LKIDILILRKVNINDERVFADVMQYIHIDFSSFISVSGNYFKAYRAGKFKEGFYPKYFNPSIPILNVRDYEGLA
jgi:hypothetical protein